MIVRPILSALWRSKTGALLIAVQVAVTLALLCNALFVVVDRGRQSVAPSGVDEADLFYVSIVTPGYDEQPFDVQRRDEALAAAVPGVREATWVSQVPLNQSGSSTNVGARRDGDLTINASYYSAGRSMVDTFGLRLVAGRDFRPEEFEAIDRNKTQHTPPVTIVSESLAKRLWGSAQAAVGQTLYLGRGADDPSVTVVGVVERLVTPWGRVDWNDSDPQGQNTYLVPARTEERGVIAVRSEPGQRDRVVQAVVDALKTAAPGRIVLSQRTMDELRERRYRQDRFLAMLLSVTIGLLLTMTAAGIVGLASLWVTQRRRQIGVRRALGARRVDIVLHFLTENLLITALGVAVGLTAAVALNGALTRVTTLAPLPAGMLLGGGAVMLLLGALATLGPALRAARIPPAEATRNV